MIFGDRKKLVVFGRRVGVFFALLDSRCGFLGMPNFFRGDSVLDLPPTAYLNGTVHSEENTFVCCYQFRSFLVLFGQHV